MRALARTATNVGWLRRQPDRPKSQRNYFSHLNINQVNNLPEARYAEILMNPDRGATERVGLEALIAADARALTAESDEVGRVFATVHQVRPSDFRALLHILVAESAGTPLTSGELRHKMGLSAAAITYLVERMINSGHILRDSDPADRRKVILRYSDPGLATARSFFNPLGMHTRAALDYLPDADLAAAHRVFTALIAAMRHFQGELGSTPS
jgi:MarR family transcriptional regulator, organic hydroperoxide resistance regulator